MTNPLNWRSIALSVVTVLAVLLALTVALTDASPVRADAYDCIGESGHPNTVDDLWVPPNETCTLNGTRVEGNIFVEMNASLHAYDVYVDGNIQSDGGALINVYQSSHVGGNIQADNAGQVNVHSSTFVGGNIQISTSGGAFIDDVDVEGDIQFEENTGLLIVTNSTIGGNVQAFYNTSDVTISYNFVGGNIEAFYNTGDLTITYNTVGGDLQVFENTDGWLQITRNDVDGDLQVQQNMGGVAILNNTVDQTLTCQANDPAPVGGSNVVESDLEDQCATFDEAFELPYKSYAPLVGMSSMSR